MPKQYGYTKLNNNLSLDRRVLDICADKNSASGLDFVGVSSFGMGGNNVHVILGHYENTQVKTIPKKQHYFFPLSAQHHHALLELIDNYSAYLATLSFDDNQDEYNFLRNMSFTLRQGRHDFSTRAMIIASSRHELLHGLKQATRSKNTMVNLSGEIDEETLLTCSNWMKGHDMLRFNDEDKSTFTRVVLPGYGFDKTVHWYKKEDWINQAAKPPASDAAKTIKNHTATDPILSTIKTLVTQELGHDDISLDSTLESLGAGFS